MQTEVTKKSSILCNLQYLGEELAITARKSKTLAAVCWGGCNHTVQVSCITLLVNRTRLLALPWDGCQKLNTLTFSLQSWLWERWLKVSFLSSVISIIYSKFGLIFRQMTDWKLSTLPRLCLQCANSFWYSLYWDYTLYFILCYKVFVVALPFPHTWPGCFPQLCFSSYVKENDKKETGRWSQQSQPDVACCGHCHYCTT